MNCHATFAMYACQEERETSQVPFQSNGSRFLQYTDCQRSLCSSDPSSVLVQLWLHGLLSSMLEAANFCICQCLLNEIIPNVDPNQWCHCLTDLVQPQLIHLHQCVYKCKREGERDYCAFLYIFVSKSFYSHFPFLARMLKKLKAISQQ